METVGLYMLTNQYVITCGCYRYATPRSSAIPDLTPLKRAQPGDEGAVRCILVCQKGRFKVYECEGGLTPGGLNRPWSQVQGFKPDPPSLSEEVWVLPPEEGDLVRYDWKGVTIVEPHQLYNCFETGPNKGAKVLTDDGHSGLIYRTKSPTRPWGLWIYVKKGCKTEKFILTGTFGWPLKEGDKLFYNLAYEVFSHIPMNLKLDPYIPGIRFQYPPTAF